MQRIGQRRWIIELCGGPANDPWHKEIIIEAVYMQNAFFMASEMASERDSEVVRIELEA
jgi:hypothetical protein